jgi:hypothetical protein
MQRQNELIKQHPCGLWDCETNHDDWGQGWSEYGNQVARARPPCHIGNTFCRWWDTEIS